MFSHREAGRMVADALQMLTEAFPEASPSFTDVKNGTTATNDAVDHIFRLTGEAITDGIDALWALYISSGCGVLARQAARMSAGIRSGICVRVARGVHKNIPQVYVPSIRHKGELGENPACLRISGQDVEVV